MFFSCKKSRSPLFLPFFFSFVRELLEKDLLLQLLECFALQFIFCLASRLKQQSGIVHGTRTLSPKIYKSIIRCFKCTNTNVSSHICSLGQINSQFDMVFCSIVFLVVGVLASLCGAQELNPRNRFCRAENRSLGSLKGLQIRALVAH